MRSSTARRAAVFGSAAILLLGPAVSISNADPVPNVDPGVASPASNLPAQLIEAIGRDLKLTAPEYLHRADLAQRLGAFAETARTHFPDVFGGSWLDEQGQAIIALADGPTKDAARTAVESAGFAVKDVSKSESALTAEKTAFDTWLAGQPNEIARLIHAVAIDTVNNALAVRIDGVANGLQLPGFLDSLRVLIAPPAIAIPPAPAPVPADIAGALPRDALAGGDGYAAVSGNASLRCSLGFNGTNAAGKVVNISAGHCDPNLPAAGTPTASGVFELRPLDARGPRVGTFEKTSLDNHDYSIIRIADDAIPRFENNGVRVPSAAPVAIDGIAVPVIGAPVCKSGARTGFSCGVVNAVDQSVAVGERHLNNAFSANICALPGDSGGTVVTGTKALGVSSASTVAEYPICEIPNLLGPFTGNEPQLFAMPISVVLAENPGLKIRTS